MSGSGIIAYFLILGGATGVALAMFFGLKAVKLI
ncbi:cytochrome b6-f complex subunit PetL [Coleofasciculus sp.]